MGDADLRPWPRKCLSDGFSLSSPFPPFHTKPVGRTSQLRNRELHSASLSTDYVREITWNSSLGLWLLSSLLLVLPLICFYPYRAEGFILFSEICRLICSAAQIALALATTGGSFLWLTELLTHTDVPMSLWEAVTEEDYCHLELFHEFSCHFCHVPAHLSYPLPVQSTWHLVLIVTSALAVALPWQSQQERTVERETHAGES